MFSQIGLTVTIPMEKEEDGQEVMSREERERERESYTLVASGEGGRRRERGIKTNGDLLFPILRGERINGFYSIF